MRIKRLVYDVFDKEGREPNSIPKYYKSKILPKQVVLFYEITVKRELYLKEPNRNEPLSVLRRSQWGQPRAVKQSKFNRWTQKLTNFNRSSQKTFLATTME